MEKVIEMNIGNMVQRVKLIGYYFTKKNALKKKKDKPRIIYLGYPMHPNLGDQAQKFCIRNWLKENYSGYEIVEIPTKLIDEDKYHYISKLKRLVVPDDIFVFQSGYCTHDLGNQIENTMHKRIISMFPNNKMLMLPQTVYFQDEDNRQEAIKVYNKANNMLFLARDFVSYDLAKEMFPKFEVCAYPDIVTSLIGTRQVNTKRSGILFCLRNDVEKFYKDDDLEQLRNVLESDEKTEVSDTTISVDPLWLDKHIGERLDQEIRKYSTYKLIITDRYHGTIFSLVAGTPVIVLKTKDHKVSTGVDWFKGVYDEYVYFARDLNEAAAIAKRVLKKSYTYQLQPYFKEKYYDHLKEHFDKTRVLK